MIFGNNLLEALGGHHLYITYCTPFIEGLKAEVEKTMTKPEPKTFQDAIDLVFEEAKQVMMVKRVQRGTGNIATQGIPGVVDRMILDKGSRLRAASVNMAGVAWLKSIGIDPESIPALQEVLSANTKSDTRDGFEDDLIDVINYSVIALFLSRGWWEKPLDEAK